MKSSHSVRLLVAITCFAFAGLSGCGGSGTGQSNFNADDAARSQRAAQLNYELEMGRLESLDRTMNRVSDAYGSPSFD